MSQHSHYRYHSIAIFSGRDGFSMSFGRALRLWRQAKLQVPKKRPSKRIASDPPRPKTPTGANQVGAPMCLRSDNGPEFVSRALLKWIDGHGIETALIEMRLYSSLGYLTPAAFAAKIMNAAIAGVTEQPLWL